MAGFRSAGRKRHDAHAPSAVAGGDASRFAAANLPPYKASPGARPATSGEAVPGADPELLAARAAAAHYDALYGNGVRPRRRSPLLMMAMVFVVGAGAGLAGAKWYASASKHPALAVPPVALSSPAAAAATAVDPDGQERALRGIRASELPYDGRMPGQAAEETPGEPKAAAAPESPRQATDRRAGEAGAKDAAGPSKAAGPPPNDAVGNKHTGSSGGIDATAPAAAAPGKATRTETPRKAAQTAKAKARANDKEVERMRRQADEELSKKTAAAQRDEPRRSSAPSPLQQVSAALASCDRRSNIILREHCRWQICNGKWGKNGCPSYASARPDPYAY